MIAGWRSKRRFSSQWFTLVTIDSLAGAETSEIIIESSEWSRGGTAGGGSVGATRTLTKSL